MDDYSRGYVFCDLFLNPDVRTTIRAIIAAMRQWQVIPKAIIFDNGSTFKGNLLSVFCARVSIRLIHASVNHPQTNGKLERGFRDDMRDFYKQRTPWLIAPLRTKHSTVIALGEDFTPEQIKKASRVSTNKAFERYFCPNPQLV
ncbi:MAG: hypothetical protein ABSH41_27835 [Syntrophobacteraceae bacterium]